MITKRYQIIRPLGEGGMGEVFLVEDLWENARQVALKKLRRGVLSEATREFFVREFTALKQLRHPNLSSVYDFGYTPQGDPFFTSEYCMGEDLITGTAQMGFSEKLERAVEICRALAYIHARGYIHADLKPENILVLPGTRTENASIKLLDFGLARHIDDQARHRLSGTLAYLAPEAMKGRPFDVRSDLYALGVAFYQLFSRQSPYGDIDPQLLVEMKLNVNPAPPTEKDGTLPVAMDGILLRLLERDPDDRFQSPDEIVKAINQGLGYQFEIETDETARDYVRSGRFVGRAAEQTQLKKALQRVLKGAGGRLILVGGESGVGKTRLLEELKIQAQLEGVRTFAGAAYEKITQPFQCFLDILRIMVLSAQQTTSANRSLSNKYDTVLSKILPSLFEGKPQPGTPSSPSANEKELLLESLAAFVMEVCAEHPTLILIQDIHWADGLSLQLLERVARSLQSQRLILGVSYRSDEVKDSALEAALPVLSGLESCDSILLRPLSQQEVGDLVNSMMGTERAPASLVQRIVNETKGNPFFIQEVIWTWMEEKIISPRSGAWNPEPAELDSLRVPQTMADAFLRRIRSLSKSERDLLQILALFIKPVPLAALSYVLGNHSSQVEVELERLVERAILARLDAVEGPHYFFQHAQMKQTLEVEVTGTFAQSLHSKIAQFFEEESSTGASDHSETLAYHFGAARNEEKARFYSIRAGDKLRHLFSYADAIGSYGIAEKFTTESDLRLFEIREKIAFCNYQLGEVDEAEQIYRSLVDEGKQYLSPGRSAKLLLRLGMLAEIRGDYVGAIELFNSGLELIQSLPEPMTRAEILSRIGWQHQHLSNFRIALDYVNRALREVEHLENFFGLGDIFNSQFAIYFCLGEYNKAIEAGHRAIAVFMRFGWMTGIAGVTANLGALYEDYLHDYKKALDYQRRSLQLREKIFNHRGMKQSYINLSSIHSKLGEYTTSLEYVDLAEKLNRIVPEKFVEMLVWLNRGENWTHLGEFEKALEALDKALGLANGTHNEQAKISILNRLTECYEKLGIWEQAQAYADSAVDLSVKTGSKLEELIGWINRTKVKIGQEEWPDAQSSVLQSITLARQLNHHDWLLQALLLSKRKELSISSPDQSRVKADELSSLVEETQNPLLKAQFHLVRGRLALAEADSFQHSGAEDLHQALRYAELTQEADLLAETRYSLGLWYQAQGDPHSADVQVQHARSILTGIAEHLPETLRKKYLEKKQRALILGSLEPSPPKDTPEDKNQAMGIEKFANPPLNRQNYSVTLFQISKIVNSILNQNDLLERVMDLVLEAIRVERGLILLVDEVSGELEVKAARNISKATLDDATAISKTVLEEVMHGGRPLISVNAHDDQRLRDRHSIVDFGIGMVLCIPLKVKEKIIGAVYIDNPVATLPFNEEDVNFLLSFTNLFAIAIENSRLYEKLSQENIYLRQEVRGKYAYENIVGRSPKMMDLFRRLDSVVNSSANVLVSGESGTGKELIARAVHYNGTRKEKRFIAIDCGAIPENLIESELFGYKRGAFTGAIFDKKGLFEEADGGTIFLDEITNTSRALQAKLLRVIQEREIRRVGDSQDRKVDVRIIAATNRDLKQMVQQGEFREDLFYRLNVLTLNVPPLREHKEDIPLLVNHLLKELERQNPAMRHTISRDALQVLMGYPFPGNVRELENLVESAFYMAQESEIQGGDFPSEISVKKGNLIPPKATVPSVLKESSPLIALPLQKERRFEETEQAMRLFQLMKQDKVSFWKAVKEPFMNREISKELVREVIKIGLQESRGRYKDLLGSFSLQDTEYTVFMNFLKKHSCQVDYKPYRQRISPT